MISTPLYRYFFDSRVIEMTSEGRKTTKKFLFRSKTRFANFKVKRFKRYSELTNGIAATVSSLSKN